MSVVVGSLRSSWWENVTRGGDRAARSCRSWQGMTAKGLLEAKAARLSKKVLKLKPSKAVLLVENPIANPPHLNDVTLPLKQPLLVSQSINYHDNSDIIIIEKDILLFFFLRGPNSAVFFFILKNIYIFFT